MPNIILFDDPALRTQLLPLTYTRPVALIRCGIHTIAEKWEGYLQTSVSFLTEDYLSEKFPVRHTSGNLYINGALCPDQDLVKSIQELAPDTKLVNASGETLAVRAEKWHPGADALSESVRYNQPCTLIRQVWDIFLQNGNQIRADFERITKNRKSAALTDPFTHCYHPGQIFIEEGAVIKAAILNAENGPVYIGRNAVVQEGSMIQGPFSLGEYSILAQGAKIRPNTTVGPHCKVGGEVSNCVISGNSNKGHDGYLGNAVLGEWCNLGANTNNSNLKNDHTVVKLYSYASGSFSETGLIFCGLIMGDYSKAGISTMFNTGTVVGVGVNVFGAGFQAKHVPSFTWGGKAEGYEEYRLEKALGVARDTVERKQVAFTASDENIMRYIFENTKEQRKA
ncbi:putative sugar nucleotidyl transferase [Dyadobacter sandarakinus]|uniref:Glucose-1-phosphate thymidylyltransferase n=1 Tax=Dyadobacter sandarakinus TaxID=2747268 RepID=A0ABX7IFH9_9BACT|nr:putative sugar nucleotidyl transferase [Dyadobacter sandarakinus]QRR04297.1 glucose-1-phosphate thymidylyltransferase [Dyadobacter sandarakinus]